MGGAAARVAEGAAQLLQLGILWLSAVYVPGALSTVFPGLDPFAAAVLGVLGSLLVTTVVLVFVIIPPKIVVDWREIGNPHPVGRIDLQKSKLRRGSIAYELSVRGAARSVAGWIVLKLMVKQGSLAIRVESRSAPIYLTSEYSTPLVADGTKRVTESPDSTGVDARILDMPTRDTWMWAKIYLAASSTGAIPTAELFQISAVPRASGRFSALCARVLIRVDMPVQQVSIYG